MLKMLRNLAEGAISGDGPTIGRKTREGFTDINPNASAMSGQPTMAVYGTQQVEGGAQETTRRPRVRISQGSLIRNQRVAGSLARIMQPAKLDNELNEDI
jgi:hypothetical protein